MQHASIARQEVRWIKQAQIDAHVADLHRKMARDAGPLAYALVGAVSGNLYGPIDWRHPLERIASRAAVSGHPVVVGELA